MHAYPYYRDSGIEWLGDLPEHWDVRAFQRVLRESLKYGANEAAELDDPDHPRFVRITDIDAAGRLRDETFRSLPSEVAKPYLLSSGDLLFARSGSVGRTFLYDDSWGPCAYAGYLIRARVDHSQTTPQFVSYFTASQSYAHWLRTVAIQATIENVSAERYSRMPIPLPPLDEQRAIAAFLDRETERIDASVEKKRLLIERLEEYRTALITRTVTRGLPPEAARAAGLEPSPRLKASGVEWLGDVPEHWSVLRLGYLASKFGSGITPRGGATIYEEAGVPFLRSQNIHFDGLRIKDVARITPEMHGELSASHVRPGDVLLNITGASIGRVCSVPDDFAEGNVNQHVCIIRVNRSQMHPDLLAAFLSTPGMQREIQLEQSGASREGLTLQSIRDFKVVVPPIREQASIVNYLGETAGNIRAAVVPMLRQIERLEEYRTALITAAVTGKIDVRKQGACEATDVGGATWHVT